MITDATTRELVFAKVDQDELVNLAMNLADFFSTTGREREIAQFVLDWFAENGLYTIKQVVEIDRFNAVGILRGTGKGPSLTFNGHLDIARAPDLKPIKAYVSNGLIHGTEIANMKSEMAAFMIGAKAIKEAGIQLKGDLVLATVVGEISTGAVGEFQDSQDRGEGIGTRYLLANGMHTDYALVADRSEYAIVWVDSGVAFFKITTNGMAFYTSYTIRSNEIDEYTNAIVKMSKVIETIEKWAQEYEGKKIYRFPGGQAQPKVSINGIQAGMPVFMQNGWRTSFNPSLSPTECNLYIDVRIPPNLTPLKVRQELAEVLRALPFECTLEMFRSQRGYEGTGSETDYLRSTIEQAYECVFRSKPPAPTPDLFSYWTDANLYREIGIPTVRWAPAETRKLQSFDVADIEGLVQAAKVYSLIALEVCGVDNNRI